MAPTDEVYRSAQSTVASPFPRKGRGRRRGSKNKVRKPKTETLTLRGESDDFRVIEGLVSSARLRSRMKLKPTQILRQALEEYEAARAEGRNLCRGPSIRRPASRSPTQ